MSQKIRESTTRTTNTTINEFMVADGRTIFRKPNRQNMTATMELQNIEIDVPKARGPDGRDLGSAKWIVNGKIVWTTELHKT